MAPKLNEMENMENWELYKLAEARVNNDPDLRKYANVLLEDWGRDAKDHLIWVITAPVKEMVEWADYISEDK